MTVEGAARAARASRAAYGVVDRDGVPTAVIEVAQVVGITDARHGDAGRATARRAASAQLARLLDRGMRRFMIGLGGSSTNDGGAGLLPRSASRFSTRTAATSRPRRTAWPRSRASTRRRSTRGSRRARSRSCPTSTIRSRGDVGATAIFGPQKGVRAERRRADRRDARALRAIVEAALGRHGGRAPGAGAAGGLGFALQLLGGAMRSGAEVVADLIGLDAALAGADWAITGEGRSDAQTLLSKAPFVVASMRARRRVPVTLLSGAVDAAALRDLHVHFAGCFALPAGPATLDECIARRRGAARGPRRKRWRGSSPPRWR